LISAFDAEDFCNAMREHDIVVSVRYFPKTAEEYYQSFKAITGHDFDQRPLTDRQRRRLEAYKYGKEWLQRYHDEEVTVASMPHLDFAIAIEAELPSRRNPRTNSNELYVPEDGVWLPSGGDMKGEVLSDALLSDFAPKRWAIKPYQAKGRGWLLGLQWLEVGARR
jgi:hypothetical protein